MNHRSYREVLDSVAADALSREIHLWPGIVTRLERKTCMTTLRTRPVLAFLVILFALTLLSGVAYAIGWLTGFIPGIGFVETSALRILAEPVAVTREGVTVSIEQVVVDSERTVIVYKTEGLTIQAANARGEGGGPFGSPHFLRLPNGTLLSEKAEAGYGGTPEPLISQVQTQGGWPNYVWRLVFPSVPQDVNELTLVIPVLQNMPAGAAPENWEITFRLKPAPPEMTFAPITILPTIHPSTPETEMGTPQPTPLSNVATLHGFTFQLTNVVALSDGFVFTGDLSWSLSAFPNGKGILASDPFLVTLTDANGQQIPLEMVRLDAPYEEYKLPWSYRTNRKAFSGPLTLSLASIETYFAASPVAFEMDFGPAPQIGQTAEIHYDFSVEGRVIRLLSASLKPAPEGCQGVMVDFNFYADVPGVSAQVNDAASPEPMHCEGAVGGGGGGLVDPKQFTITTTYRDMPSGVHRFAIEFWLPHRVEGPWQVQWNPPLSTEPTPMPEPAACLRLDKWNQIKEQSSTLPAEVSGTLVTMVNEGGPLPAIYLNRLNGTDVQRVDIGAWASLSPSGTRLVYSAQSSLRLLDLSSSESFSFGADGNRIIWSPDEKRFLFTGPFNVYIAQADGSALQRVKIEGGQVLAPVGWLDDQTIVYSVLSGEKFDLRTYNLQSGESNLLFPIHNKAGYAAVSPDGQWLVFADREFGQMNWGIFISRPDGSERKRVVDPEVPTAFMSIWGPDSQWLIVNVQEDGQNIPVLLNPFTCQVFVLRGLRGTVEGWGR